MRHSVQIKMVSNAEGIPETLARALLTNTSENWLTAITDLGILSSQESVESTLDQTLLGDENVATTVTSATDCLTMLHQQQQQQQQQSIPCLHELSSWHCAVTPEPSPTPSYSTDSVFDFNNSAVVAHSPMSPASTGVASPSPSLGSESTVDLSFIKEGLRSKIQSKRRKSGLGDLQVDIKPEVHDLLTPADENRRERRRASNRRAALKCRQKKKEEQEKVLDDYRSTKEKLIKLQKEHAELLFKYQQLVGNPGR